MPKVAPRPERSSNSSSDPNQNNCLSPPPLLPHNVPPEQINNFVYASPQDRLVMDFGEIKLDDHQRPLSVASGSAAATLPPPRPLSQQSSSASMSSSTSTSGLLKRVRRTIAPTLNRARRKSASSSADNGR